MKMALLRSQIIRDSSAFAKQIAMRQFHTTDIAMDIAVGDRLPKVNLFEDTPTHKINVGDLASNKKVVFFGVTGAFNPKCSDIHLPSYIDLAPKMKMDGIDEIVCISVNDPFVMAAWGNHYETEGKIRMLADPQADFVKSLELSIDIPCLGGLRSKRFSMLVDNGYVQELNVEPDGKSFTCCLAYQLKYKQEKPIEPSPEAL